MSKNKKERVDIVYSTNPDFRFSYAQDEDAVTPDPTRVTSRSLQTKHTVSCIPMV